MVLAWADPEGGPPGKSQVVISFLRNTGTNPPREAINPCHAEYFLCTTLLPNAVFHLSEKCIFKQSLKKVWILIRCHVPKPADLALQCFYKSIYWVQQDKGKG